MDLNNIIFPSPSFEDDLSNHTNELLFIPKKKIKKTDEDSFIPTLLLFPIFKSKNFLVFFHGNAEDIFLARNLGEELRIKLNV
jgi:hypothetical protein